VHHLSDGGRDGHKNGHFGLVAIEQQAVALEAVSLQGHSIENGQPGPAHSGESMLPGAKERLVEIAVSSPFSVGIGAVNDLREF